MGRRQIRLRGKNIRAEMLKPFLSYEMDAVLNNGVTLHGRLQALENEGLVLHDLNKNLEWPTARLHVHSATFDSITEIVLMPYAPF